jgi:hypothetical protein
MAQLSVSNLGGRKNFLINGSMNVAQRAVTGIALTTTSSYVSIDRWFAQQVTSAASNFGWSGTSIPAGFVRQAALNRNNGATSTGIIGAGQIIESVDAVPLAGKQATLSFIARCGGTFSATGSLINVQIVSGTVADEGRASLQAATWTGQTMVLNASQAITGTATQYSFTATIPSGCKELAVLIKFTPVGTAGNDDTLYFTGVQLEIGSVVTQFEYRSYGEELSLCQRYYFLAITAWGAGSNANVADIFTQFPVEMRKVPEVGTPAANLSIWDGQVGTATQSSPSASIVIANTKIGMGVRCLNFTGLTAGRFYVLSAGGIPMDAEL